VLSTNIIYNDPTAISTYLHVHNRAKIRDENFSDVAMQKRFKNAKMLIFRMTIAVGRQWGEAGCNERRKNN
jgi:hypothetical protein